MRGPLSLGFATIAEGDITLTSLGETFAEASIQARKETFATRIHRLPLFQWLFSITRLAFDPEALSESSAPLDSQDISP